MSDSVWTKKGATLSDKSARTEFGLTQEEIIKAMRSEGDQEMHRNSLCLRHVLCRTSTGGANET